MALLWQAGRTKEKYRLSIIASKRVWQAPRRSGQIIAKRPTTYGKSDRQKAVRDRSRRTLTRTDFFLAGHYSREIALIESANRGGTVHQSRVFGREALRNWKHPCWSIGKRACNTMCAWVKS